MRSPGARVSRSPDALAGADMLYSSGTTGRPKGIKPREVREPLYAPDLYTGVTQRVLGFEPGDVYLSPAPLYHAAPLRGCMSVHRLGGTVVLMRHFDPERALALIESHRVTHSQFVPTMFRRMLRLGPEVRRRYDVSSLRSVIHAAAPCPIEVKRAMIDWWGPIINEYYGATEACGSTWITSEEWLAHPGSVGRAVVGRLHIVDDDGSPSSRRARPGRSTSPTDRSSSTTTTPGRRPKPMTRGGGRPAATSVGSTRRATCT